jgi:hypothetical protein
MQSCDHKEAHPLRSDILGPLCLQNVTSGVKGMRAVLIHTSGELKL